jgi:hypothetical protein
LQQDGGLSEDFDAPSVFRGYGDAGPSILSWLSYIRHDRQSSVLLGCQLASILRLLLGKSKYALYLSKFDNHVLGIRPNFQKTKEALTNTKVLAETLLLSEK